MRNRATLRFHCYTLEEISSNRACRSNTFFVPSRFNPAALRPLFFVISPFFFPFLISFFAYRSDFRHCCSSFSRIFHPSLDLISRFSLDISLLLCFFFLSPSSSHISRTEDRVDRHYFCYFFVIAVGTTRFDLLFSRNMPYLLYIFFLIRNLC